MRAKRITIYPLIVREEQVVRVCVLSRNFFPSRSADGESRGQSGREPRRLCNGASCISRGVSAVVLPGVRTHTGAAQRGALMHIGIVANAPGRKKKMNREALPWLAVRAVPAGLLFAGASISRRCNLSSATPLRRFSLVSASAGCVGRGAAKCRTGTFVPRRFVVQRDAPHVSNGRTLRLILVRRNGRD